MGGITCTRSPRAPSSTICACVLYHPPRSARGHPARSLAPLGQLANPQVIGTISRLAPTSAHLSIQISNSRPVPESSEEFTGVIRLADIRLTERDKIKMGDCFRLGDLVKARVVGPSLLLSLLMTGYGCIYLELDDLC